MLSPDQHYANALSDVCSAYHALRPPRRVTVTQGATDNLMIKQPGGYVGNWSADETPYMPDPMNMLASRRHEAVCFVGPARTGKCLDIETKIPTPAGWVRMGDLVAGDVVFGPDGKPTTVLAAHDVKYGLPCYRVDFSDGTNIVADGDHLWGVERFYWKEPQWRYEVKRTEDLVSDLIYSKRDDGRKRYRYRVRNTEPIECPSANLLIDPYLLGVWLGDGGTNQAVISSHCDDAAHYVDALSIAGHTTTVSSDGVNTVRIAIDLRDRLTTHCRRGHEFSVVGRTSNGGCAECSRRSYHHRKHGAPMGPMLLFADTFASRLHKLGVHGRKHIPKQYLRASVEQRSQLLRGMMDTDGTFDQRAGRVEFTTVLPSLASDFCELARSLGFKPTTSLKSTSWEYLGERKVGAAFRISFPVDGAINPFSLPRKANAVRFATTDVGYRQIVNITVVETRPVRCIQVDNTSHLFLAGEGMVPTHNTMGLLEGWGAHIIVNDPGDYLIVQMTQDKSREYSKARIDRMLRHSDKLRELKSGYAKDDNTHDKMFKNGMILKIGWPTVSQLSSSDYRYVALTDYDRMPLDIDGEGSAFALGLKRTTTFLSRGMCLVESSPGYDIIDPNWKPVTPHEAPPADGILSIYNRGDRRRWYWQCRDCSEWFEAAPGIGLFDLPPRKHLLDIVREADLDALAEERSRVVCPHCGSLIDKRWKHELNRAGRWLPDGVHLDKWGDAHGTPMTSSIASYWLGGVAAAYQPWKSLVLRYLQGLREYAMAGSEQTLRTTVNTDQGMPYLPMHLAEAQDRNANPVDRAESLDRFTVPAETRYLTAHIDVQGGNDARFEVQITASGPNNEKWVINRFAIRDSRREGVGTKWAPIDPASYVEDWDRITDEVLLATYKTPIEGKELRILMTTVDTGGEKGQDQDGKKTGVTVNSYAWYRRLRQRGDKLHERVMLCKGTGKPDAPLIRKSMVGAVKTGEKGDVPLYTFNANLIKDTLDVRLKRTTPGPGYIHFPLPRSAQNPDGWLPAAFFDELKAEVREKNGTWKKIRKRNEAWDLLVASIVCDMRLKVDTVRDWDKPPKWAAPLAQNSELVTAQDRRDMKDNAVDQREVTPAPAPVPRPVVRRPRRTISSPYLG